MSAIAIIPARGGSRRIPKKNVLPFMGKPMLAYAIEAARDSKLFDQVYVSTDDLDIAATAEEFGAKVHVRRPELARDEVGTQEVTRAVLLDLFAFPNRDPALPKITCCIYPCVPTLRASDLIEAHRLLKEKIAASYVMVTGMFYLGYTWPFLDELPLENHVIELPPSVRWLDINDDTDLRQAQRIYLATMKKEKA